MNGDRPVLLAAAVTILIGLVLIGYGLGLYLVSTDLPSWR